MMTIDEFLEQYDGAPFDLEQVAALVVDNELKDFDTNIYQNAKAFSSMGNDLEQLL